MIQIKKNTVWLFCGFLKLSENEIFFQKNTKMNFVAVYETARK